MQAVFCRLVQDIRSPSLRVREDQQEPSLHPPEAGVTLLELLVTMAVIAALASLAIPGWGLLSKTGAQRRATAAVMESLERARSEAITSKQEVWVLFRHHSNGDQPDAVRILAKEGGLISPLGTWIKLPSSITFRMGAGTLMDDSPPSEILKAALPDFENPGDSMFGAVMFRRGGGVGNPKQGGNSLSVALGAGKKGPDSTITIARAAGRACVGSP